MISDTHNQSVRMEAKARETAARVAVEATGVGLSREARTRLSWMDFYRETKNAADLPPFRDRAADLL